MWSGHSAHLASSASLMTTTGCAPEKYCAAAMRSARIPVAVSLSILLAGDEGQEDALSKPEGAHLEHLSILLTPLCVHNVWPLGAQHRSLMDFSTTTSTCMHAKACLSNKAFRAVEPHLAEELWQASSVPGCLGPCTYIPTDRCWLPSCSERSCDRSSLTLTWNIAQAPPCQGMIAIYNCLQPELISSSARSFPLSRDPNAV